MLEIAHRAERASFAQQRRCSFLPAFNKVPFSYEESGFAALGFCMSSGDQFVYLFDGRLPEKEINNRSRPNLQVCGGGFVLDFGLVFLPSTDTCKMEPQDPIRLVVGNEKALLEVRNCRW